MEARPYVRHRETLASGAAAMMALAGGLAALAGSFCHLLGCLGMMAGAVIGFAAGVTLMPMLALIGGLALLLRACGAAG